MVGKEMNRTFGFLILLFSLCMNAQAEKVQGTVKGGGKALGEVIVTDGFSFAVTDSKGHYTIDLNDKTEFVYLLTPKGYVADFSSGVPQFYQRVEKSKTEYDFSLEQMKGDPNRFAMITMADTQLDTEHDVARMMDETLPDIQNTLKQYDGVQTAGIVLGDISWDMYVRNVDYKSFVRKLGIPVYPVIGNHDFDKYMTASPDADYAHIYKENFGPLYYAFQLGDVYYIVLNDMIYYGNKRYKTTLEIEDQMKWLELMLNCVLQQDKQVIIAMHAPLKPSSERPMIDGGEHLKKMLMNKFQSAFITGHFHCNSNTDIGAGIMEHNLGAVCGTWWNGDTGSDGAPNGYQVFEGNGSEISWYYKATGHDRDWQFSVYPVGSVMERPESIVAKVWNWDDAWRIRWYEDGKLMGDMSRFYTYDPDYLRHLNGRRAVADYEPARTDHYFSATPSEDAKVVRIEVVDRFGNTYTQEVNVKK